MRLLLAAIVVCALLAIFLGMYPSSQAPLTEAPAAENAERLFAIYLKDVGLERSAFGDPTVEISDGDALVSFRLRRSEDEGVIVTLGKDGSQGISPNIPSRDFPTQK